MSFKVLNPDSITIYNNVLSSSRYVPDGHGVSLAIKNIREETAQMDYDEAVKFLEATVAKAIGLYIETIHTLTIPPKTDRMQEKAMAENHPDKLFTLVSDDFYNYLFTELLKILTESE